MAMTYGNVYVAEVAMGANDDRRPRLPRGRSYDGPRSSSPTATASLTASTWPRVWSSRKLAVDAGYWPLYRFDPRLQDRARTLSAGLTCTQDSAVRVYNENRYRMLTQCIPRRRRIDGEAQDVVNERWRRYKIWLRCHSNIGAAMNSHRGIYPVTR